MRINESVSRLPKSSVTTIDPRHSVLEGQSQISTVLNTHLAPMQEADLWRAAANGHRSVCYLLGFTPAEIEQRRRTINNSNYCRVEWDLLERQSHIHEYKLAEQCRQSAEQPRSAEHRKEAAKQRRLSERAARPGPLRGHTRYRPPPGPRHGKLRSQGESGRLDACDPNRAVFSSSGNA